MLLAATGSTTPFFIAAATFNLLGMLLWNAVRGGAKATGRTG